MTSTRAGILGVLIGLFSWPLLYALFSAASSTAKPTTAEIFSGIARCSADPIGCLIIFKNNLTAGTAYGAVLGVIGLLIQLWLRDAWPRGQLNAGRPKVLEPGALVTAAVAAIVAGVSAKPLVEGSMSAVVTVTFCYFIADAATLGVEKISALVEKVKARIQSRMAAR